MNYFILLKPILILILLFLYIYIFGIKSVNRFFKKAIVTETSFDFGEKKPPLIVIIPLNNWKDASECQDFKENALKECLENNTLSANEILLNQEEYSFESKLSNAPTVKNHNLFLVTF